MPFYADNMFYTRPLVPVFLPTGTATIAGTGTLTNSTFFVASANLPQYVRRTAITNVQVQVVVAPVATGEVLNFTNGTSTFASCTVGTLTAGQVVTVAPTANNTFAAAAGPGCTIVAIGTNPSIGQLTVWFETNELYA